MTFSAKVVIVTGAGSGYGRGIADKIKHLGANLVIVDISDSTGRQAATELGGSFVKADVTKREDWEEVLHKTLEEHGRVDVIVNNAGVCYDKQPSETVPETVLDFMLAVNLKAFFHSVGVIVPHLLSQKQKAVFVSIASTSGIRPRPELTWYNASKSALITASNSLAVEYASRNIRFNTVCPVIGRTSMYVSPANIQTTLS
jgi:NAD(P)-dependent dehydrogenase (short-subunit alcohol dehydrogenase family)